MGERRPAGGVGTARALRARHLGPDLEAWITASAIGAATRRIKSMVAVHPGLWHPALIAKMAASLDRISSGRMAINLVTGWNEVEHRMFGGISMPANDDRYVRAGEYIEVLRGLWTTSPFSYAGRFYQLDNVELMLQSRHSMGDDRPKFMQYTQAGLNLYVEVQDFADLQKRMQGADIVEPVRTTFYGMQEIVVKEPGGNTVGFAQFAQAK